jgi:hypothetical protein
MIWARSNVQHQGEFRLEILAQGEEEPLVRVDFSIVSLLDAETEVDSAPFQDVTFDSKIPCRHLKNVQNIGWHSLRLDALIHDIPHLLHSPHAFSIWLHESLLEEHFLVQILPFPRHCFEGLWDFIVSIDDDAHHKVIFGELVLLVKLQAIVVVDQS